MKVKVTCPNKKCGTKFYVNPASLMGKKMSPARLAANRANAKKIGDKRGRKTTLTEADVAEILRLIPHKSQRNIAEKFSVHESTISRIKNQNRNQPMESK